MHTNTLLPVPVVLRARRLDSRAGSAAAAAAAVVVLFATNLPSAQARETAAASSAVGSASGGAGSTGASAEAGSTGLTGGTAAAMNPIDSTAHSAHAPGPHTGSGWKFTLAPYLWVPAVSGDATVGAFTSDINITQRDAFEALGDLEAGLSLHFEAKYERWSLFGDMMYFKLGSDSIGPIGGTLRTRFEQGIFEIGAAYRILERPLDDSGATTLIVEPLGGVRVYYFEGRIHSDALARSEERDQTWADVFGGVRGAVSFLSGKVSLFGRFDIGAGGSDLAWNALTGVDLRFADCFSLIGGYRWLSIDYTTGDGLARFEYDILSEGPFMAMEFRF